MAQDAGVVHGACHCDTVQFQARLSGGLGSAARCNCSLCRMRGAIVVTALIEDLKVTAGEDALALYQFNTGAARHYFCSKCGIYTHHQRRSNPGEFAVNAACLEGVSPFDFESVPVTDGVHHTSDGYTRRVVGTLSFMPAK